MLDIDNKTIVINIIIKKLKKIVISLNKKAKFSAKAQVMIRVRLRLKYYYLINFLLLL